METKLIPIDEEDEEDAEEDEDDIHTEEEYFVAEAAQNARSNVQTK